jgi:DNA polymerase elongation subunit (family B)
VQQQNNKTNAKKEIKVEAKVKQKLGRYVAFDFEWDNVTHVLQAASFVDSEGNKKVFFNKGSEIELIQNIVSELLEYDTTMGWNSSVSIEKNTNHGVEMDIAESNIEDGEDFVNTDIKCDFGILHERCEANGLTQENIIEKQKRGNRTYYSIPHFNHIDLYQVFSKQLVKIAIHGDKYRTFGIDDVAKALLDYGKYKGISGKDFQKLSQKDKEKYAFRDSELVMELSKYKDGDYRTLDAMLAIADITGLDFNKVCRSNLTTWWGVLFDEMVQNHECPAPIHNFKRSVDKEQEGKPQYKGATVLDPTPGLYYNVVVVDALSLYPTMGIQYNLSFETINCDCCKNDPKARARVKKIDDQFFEGCKFISKDSCWICQREGAFPKKLKIFKERRVVEKQLAKKGIPGAAAKDKALKILINGGYGCFGSIAFAYYNPMVAEFVTTFGRYTLSKMQNIAHSLGFEIIGGDTDSLFLNNPPSKKALEIFKEKCKEQLDVDLETKNVYRKFIQSIGKKHYIGIGVDSEKKFAFDIVGFEGKKKDRCGFIRQVFNDVVTTYMQDNKDPIPKLRKAFSNLEQGKVAPELLIKSICLSNHPRAYKDQTCQAAKIGKALGARKGELIEYYSADEKKSGDSWTQNPEEISIEKYKQATWNTVDEVLKRAGFPVAELTEEFGVKLVPEKNKDKTTATKKNNKKTRNKISISYSKNQKRLDSHIITATPMVMHSAEPPRGMTGYAKTNRLHNSKLTITVQKRRVKKT